MKKEILALLLALSLPALAQVEMTETYSNTAPQFYFDALNFRTEKLESRLDFYLQVPYSELQFIKHGNEYLGSYEVSIVLTDDDGNNALEETWEERPISESFNETSSTKIYSSSQKEFIVRPGKYTLKVAVTDSETNKSFAGRRNFVARNYSDTSSISMSDIMVLKGSSITSGKRTIIPNIEANVISQMNTFPIFFEIYFPNTADSVYATVEISGGKNGPNYSASEWITGHGTTNRVIFDVPKDSMLMGNYQLQVELRHSADKDSSVLCSSSRRFSVHIPDLPLTITDLDLAADEMLYVAKSGTIDSIKSAKDMLAKEKVFLAFWQRYNPNPSSKQNPVMEEYFNRVAYANAHFSHYFPGWKSDMGMIYILFGPPNSVDRHPFEVDSKPYEVWDYFQRNRQFVFIDETGFGDYRLMNPISDVYSTPYGPDFIGR